MGVAEFFTFFTPAPLVSGKEAMQIMNNLENWILQKK